MDAIEARGVVNQWMQVPQRSLGRRDHPRRAVDQRKQPE